MKDVKDLRALHVLDVPRYTDWSNWPNDDDEPPWIAFNVAECEECGALHTAHTHAIGVEEEQCRDLGDTNCSGRVAIHGPAMNYFYPCELDLATLADQSAAAEALQGLPLCVVTLDDGATGLALTGGGMDLSWEICEAYIRLGYLPPYHFTLPSMADRRDSPTTRLVIAACMESANAVAARAKRRVDQLWTLAQQIEAEAHGKGARR